MSIVPPTDDVVVEDLGALYRVVLNRADRKNAYDPEMLSEMYESITNAPSSAACIVLTGTGDSFCGGGFLGDLADPNPKQLSQFFSDSLDLMEAIRRVPQPVIAAVNGFAIGGGNELVAACDLAVAVESAQLGQNGTRIGSAPVFGGTNHLSMVIGEKRAKEVSFLSRRYSANEAKEMGWINWVVPDGELDEAVHNLVDEIVVLSPRYLEIAKISSNYWWNLQRPSFVDGLGMLKQAIGSDDMREGVSAFFERRRPRFSRL